MREDPAASCPPAAALSIALGASATRLTESTDAEYCAGHGAGVAVVDGFRCRSSASSINLSSNAENPTPLCSHILGYMLMDVNPGMVLISLM